MTTGDSDKLIETLNEDVKVIPRNVTMYPEQWATVDEINEYFGFRNISTALRHIVNEYRRMKAGDADKAD